VNINAAASCTVSSQSITISSLLSTTTGGYVGGSAKQLKFTLSQMTMPETT
jgi:hypothetical protein